MISAKITIGEFFGLPDGDVYIELREPNTKAMFKLESVFKSGDSEKIVNTFVDMLPGIIVSHSLMKSETEMMTPLEVAGIVEKKLQLFMKVLEEYKTQVLFSLGKKVSAK